jgi:hypothetical protein
VTYLLDTHLLPENRLKFQERSEGGDCHHRRLGEQSVDGDLHHARLSGATHFRAPRKGQRGATL